jgi:hypothetical protein
MDPVTGLSLGRIAVGVGSLVAPARTATLLGLDAPANPQLSYFARMFGAREIALGAITLASKGALRRNLVLAGMAVDGSDAVTGALGLKSKELPSVAGAMLVAGAVGAVGSSVAGLVRGGAQQNG